MPNIHELRATYADLPDGRLLELADREVGDLTPEAAHVLHEELCRRGFADSIGAAAAAQSHSWTPQEIDALLIRFRGLPCPKCGGTGHLLNAFTVVTVRSFLIYSRREERLIVGCPKCVESAAKAASLISMTLGWWHLPFGPIATLSALAANCEAQIANQKSDATDELKEFVAHNRGHIVQLLKSEQTTHSTVPGTDLRTGA